MKKFTLATGCLILAAGLAVHWFGLPPDIRREREFQFVYDTLLTREGGDLTSVVARWVSPVTFAFRSDNNDALSSQVVEILRELDRVVGPNFVSFTSSPDAAVWVYVESRLVVKTMMERRSWAPSTSGPGAAFFNVRMNEDWEIIDGFVMVDAEQSPWAVSTGLIQELTQVLGPMGDSPVFPESVMYETAAGGSYTTSLAPIDRKLLRFLYRYLKPGDDEAAVRAAFDKYWDSIPSD